MIKQFQNKKKKTNNTSRYWIKMVTHLHVCPVQLLDVKVVYTQVQLLLAELTRSDRLQVRAWLENPPPANWLSLQVSLYGRLDWSVRCLFTWVNFRAEPPLDALLVNVLQTAGTVARLDQGVGGRLLAHLADPAQVALLLVRLLQQQSRNGMFPIHSY